MNTRLLSRLVGHRLSLRPLFDAYRAERLASTLLFVGPSGIGKRQAALAFAQILTCEAPERDTAENLACGECGSCRRIASGQSESLLLIEPDGAHIKIEQVRDILQFISLRKLGRHRIVIIDQAHLLNPQAGNALLKSLEEPPAGTYFILVSTLSSGVLTTIRSRSQLVRFKPLSSEELREVLGGEADEWLVASARGSVEEAKRLSESRDDFLALEAAVRDYLVAASVRLPMDEISRLKEMMKDRSAQGFVSSFIQTVLRDALLLQAGLPSRQGRAMELVQSTAGYTPVALRTLAENVLGFEQDLARNVERGLILENFALTWRRAAKMEG